jgi:hypothetical protein
MKITKNHLIKLIKEEISNVRESDAYDAITSDLPDIIAKLPMETVIRIIMGEVDLEPADVAAMVTNMPELEMENIYNALRSQAGE